MEPSVITPHNRGEAAGSLASLALPDLLAKGSAVPLVAALFVRHDSIYKQLPGVSAYDLERNALTWSGGCPVIAHPPCRSWSRLRAFAKPAPGERWLAHWSVIQVRRWGGVLEHPAGSLLWNAAKLPAPGTVDAFGGWSMCVDQSWWGHRAAKRTLLYIVGCPPAQIPDYSPNFIPPPRVVAWSRSSRSLRRTHIHKHEREHTPVAFAQWLIALAQRCTPPIAPAAAGVPQ